MMSFGQQEKLRVVVAAANNELSLTLPIILIICWGYSERHRIPLYSLEHYLPGCFGES